MEKKKFIYFKTLLKLIKVTTFSSLPYSVFKTSTLLDSVKSTPKTRFGKFKFRQTLVSLRAPKHFKVGRQHYSTGSRFSLFLFKNKQTKWNQISTLSNLQSISNNLHNIPEIHLNQPLTTIKTIKITLSLKFKINCIN